MITYTIGLEDASGAQVALITAYTRLDYARAINSVGTLELTLPDTSLLPLLSRNSRLKIYRHTPTGSYLEGQTDWFVRRIELSDSARTIVVRAVTALDILKRRLVAYPATSIQADKTEDNGTSLPADDMIRQYLRENVGVDCVDPARVIPDLLITPDESLCPVVEKAAGWANLLDTLREISDALWESDRIRILFDLTVGVAGHLAFTTRILLQEDIDLAVPVVFFGARFGNLNAGVYAFDYTDEATVAYVGGLGQDIDRLIAVIQDDARLAADPFNRIELFVDDREEWSDLRLQSDGELALRTHAPRIEVTGDVVDGVNATYGIDYTIGSVVAVQVDRYQANCFVEAIHIQSDASGSMLELKLLGTTPA